MNYISWMNYIASKDFMNFHGWTSIPFWWLQIHIIIKKDTKKTWNFKWKPFNFLSICSKNKLEDSLKFERTPLKLQRAIKWKQIKKWEQEGKGGGGCGGICSWWEIFFLKSGAEVFSRPEKFRPWTLKNLKICGQLQSSFSQLGLHCLAM